MLKEEIEDLKFENEQLAKALGKATIKAEWAAGCSEAEFRNEVRTKGAWT